MVICVRGKVNHNPIFKTIDASPNPKQLAQKQKNIKKLITLK